MAWIGSWPRYALPAGDRPPRDPPCETGTDDFVHLLTEATDFVLFSAAVPMQGGTHHVNERWQQYWIGKFFKVSYSCFDVIRPRIWAVEGIPPYYNQNTFLLARRERAPEVRARVAPPTGMPANAVHPAVFKYRMSRKPGVRESMGLLWQAIRRSARARFRALMPR